MSINRVSAAYNFFLKNQGAVVRASLGAYLMQLFYFIVINSDKFLKYKIDFLHHSRLEVFLNQNFNLNYESLIVGVGTVGILLSLVFCFGVATKISALFLVCLIGFLPDIASSIHVFYFGYINWLLLVFCLFTEAPWFSLKRQKQKFISNSWRLPLLLSFSLSMTLSGVDKMKMEEWFSGQVLERLYHNAYLLRPYLQTEHVNSGGYSIETDLNLENTGIPYRLRSGYELEPFGLYRILSVYTLLAEVLALFFALIPQIRLIGWLLGVLLQVGILLILRINEVNLAMIILYMMLYEHKYIEDFVKGARSRIMLQQVMLS